MKRKKDIKIYLLNKKYYFILLNLLDYSNKSKNKNYIK